MAAALAASPDLAQTPEVVVLDNETAVYGDQAVVRQAANRWSQSVNQDADLAAKLTRMSESFDNWLIAIRPLENAAEPSAGSAPLKYRADFVRLVREVRAGIRLGGINQVQVEVEMNTAEDAAGLVALGRWLPGLLQMRGDWEASMAELAENVAVWQNGNTASFSFTLDENKLKEFVRSREAMEKWRDEPVIIE
jgi:hypothetical protein